jgi:septum formation protein
MRFFNAGYKTEWGIIGNITITRGTGGKFFSNGGITLSIENDVHIVLASSSPRRRQLLQSLGLSFEIFPSQVDENFPATLPPSQIVEMLAERKASAVAEEVRKDNKRAKSGRCSLVIGSDTIVVADGEVLGKPVDRREAEAMLSRLQGRLHEVYTGLAVLKLENQSGKTLERHVGYRRTSVRMRPLMRDEIKRYAATGEPLDKAGGYAIQGLGSTLVEEITGDYFAVVGLPLSLLHHYLHLCGYEVF